MKVFNIPGLLNTQHPPELAKDTDFGLSGEMN